MTSSNSLYIGIDVSKADPIYFYHLFLFNMTVWQTFDDLKRFVFNQIHTAVMHDRDEWFDKMPKQVSVMWWVKIGDRPTMAQALQKIELINQIGSSQQAFNFANYFGWQTENE